MEESSKRRAEAQAKRDAARRAAAIKAREEAEEAARWKDDLLEALAEGVVPNADHIDETELPFVKLKSEHLIAGWQDVSYYTTKRVFKGHSQGMSIRVAKGVTYRAGASRGTPVDEFQRHGSGSLMLTTKHLYFTGYAIDGKAFRIRLDRTARIEAMSDAVMVMRDTASAKPEAFGVPDPKWVARVIKTVAAGVEDGGKWQTASEYEEARGGEYLAAADAASA